MFKSNAAKTTQKIVKIQVNSNITFIATGCKIGGNIECIGNLRIEGDVAGNVAAQGDVEISADGHLVGDLLSAYNVVVYGYAKIKIRARGQLSIHKNAVVDGDVSAVALDIENGARFVGYSSTGAAEAEVSMLDQAAIVNSGAAIG